VLRVVTTREEAEEEVLGPPSMRFNGEAGRDVEKELGEYPSMLDASRLLKPTVLRDVEQPPAVYFFQRGYAWMLKTHDQASAEKVARRAHKNLVGKRSLVASDPYLHHRKLFVAYPGGYVTHPGLPEKVR
jgi:hypothetical protein